MSGMIESVTIILELLAILLCLSNLYEKGIKLDFYVFSLAVIDIFIITGINECELPPYVSIFVYVAVITYCLFYYKKNLRITLVNCCLAFLLIGLLQLIYCIPVYYLYDREKGIPGFNSFLINLLSIATVLIVKNKIRLKQISDFIQRKSWIIKAFFTLIVIYLLINLFHMQVNDAIENMDFIQIIFFVLLFFLAVNEWQKAILDAERKKTQLEMNKLYYDAYDELILLIRERQHDMKNHINAILGMIYTIDNYEDLVASQKKYCNDVIIKSKETKLLLSIGNPLIAGFLYRKLQEAQKSKITIECKVASNESCYIVPEYELIEMLGIMIDNAIDALKGMEIDKKILVKIEDRKNELLILVANISRYYKPDEICRFFQKDFTSKGKGHGIGLSKLKKMIKERKGDIAVTNEMIDGSNFLQFCIVLPKRE